MSQIRLAIIGGGFIGRRHAGVIAKSPEARRVGGSDPRQRETNYIVSAQLNSIF